MIKADEEIFKEWDEVFELKHGIKNSSATTTKNSSATTPNNNEIVLYALSCLRPTCNICNRHVDDFTYYLDMISQRYVFEYLCHDQELKIFKTKSLFNFFSEIEKTDLLTSLNNPVFVK